MTDNFFDKLEDIEMFEEVLELLLLVEDWASESNKLCIVERT